MAMSDGGRRILIDDREAVFEATLEHLRDLEADVEDRILIVSLVLKGASQVVMIRWMMKCWN